MPEDLSAAQAKAEKAEEEDQEESGADAEDSDERVEGDAIVEGMEDERHGQISRQGNASGSAKANAHGKVPMMTEEEALSWRPPMTLELAELGRALVLLPREVMEEAKGLVA